MRDRAPSPLLGPVGRWAVLAAALLTVVAGVVMRWALAGAYTLPWDFGHLRHAHSHLGYYGVLVPLAWYAWARAGLPRPSVRVVVAYALAVGVATVGFLRIGYGIEAIIGSTVVGAIWLLTAWITTRRWRSWTDPIGGVLPGMTLTLACVPFVARNTRADPALAQQWVATFLAALLLLVVVPSALGALRVRRPWPVLLVAGALGAAALGVWSAIPARVGLAVYAALVLPVVWPTSTPVHARAMWGLLGVGVLAMALGLVPNTRPVVIAAIHFTALSVCLPALATVVGLDLRAALWWGHHAAVGLLCLPIGLQPWDGRRWTWIVAAIGGTLVLAEIVALGGWWGVRAARTPSD